MILGQAPTRGWGRTNQASRTQEAECKLAAEICSERKFFGALNTGLWVGPPRVDGP
jgi:hypothetical protein